MTSQNSESEALAIQVVSANQARELAPQNHPIPRELWRKVMGYTFHLVDSRAKAGYSYVEAGLTSFPALEARRIKVLKRLGFTVREHEFSLFVGWEDGKERI